MSTRISTLTFSTKDHCFKNQVKSKMPHVNLTCISGNSPANISQQCSNTNSRPNSHKHPPAAHNDHLIIRNSSKVPPLPTYPFFTPTEFRTIIRNKFSWPPISPQKYSLFFPSTAPSQSHPGQKTFVHCGHSVFYDPSFSRFQLRHNLILLI